MRVMKNYINPLTTVVPYEGSTMICGSPSPTPEPLFLPGEPAVKVGL